MVDIADCRDPAKVKAMKLSQKLSCSSKKMLPVEVLRILSDENKWSIKLNVIENKRVPVDVLEKLSRDGDFIVASAALKKLEDKYSRKLSEYDKLRIGFAQIEEPDIKPSDWD